MILSQGCFAIHDANEVGDHGIECFVELFVVLGKARAERRQIDLRVSRLYVVSYGPKVAHLEARRLERFCWAESQGSGNECDSRMAALARPGEILSMVSRQNSIGLDEFITVERAALSIGDVDLLQGRRMRQPSAPHMHDVFALGIVDSGKARIRYRRREECVSAGAIITISTGEMHAAAPVGDRGWSYRMIYPQRDLFRTALGGALDDDETLLFPSPFVADAEVCRMLHAAFDSLVDAECSLAGEERLLALFRVLAVRHSSRPPRAVHVRGAAAVVETARAYLHAHFTDNIQLSTLASICGVSPFHLIRLFRRRLGLPPHAYLKQIRLGHALGLLRDGVLVSHVAYTCGFSDQSHLTRSFKRTFGVTPGAYQRAVRSNVETRRTA